MNKIFKSIWNEQTGTYVAVSENTRSKGKKSSSTLCTALAVALGTFSLSAQAWEWHISDGTNQNSISTLLTGQTATFSGDGKNISTELSNRTLTVKLKDDLDLTSVKTGASILNNNGLSITGGPSVTAAGIAAGGNAITGVAMIGTPNGTDAVNVDYLNTQIDANKTRYFSVNSTGGANVNNDGATGVDAIAIGKDTKASGISSTAVGHNASATASRAVAVGTAASATGSESTALGSAAQAFAGSATAIGFGARADQYGATATGTNSRAQGQYSAAYGQNASATASRAVAVGTAASATGSESTALGSAAQAFAGSATAIGFGARADQYGATATGTNSRALGQYSAAYGQNASATASRAVAVGTAASATGSESTALGSAAQAFAGSATAIGFGARADQYGATATGTNSRALGQYSAAYGQNAQANNAYDVALGAGSSTDAAVGTSDVELNGTPYTFAGVTPRGTVSVGSAGNERTITNVAAGRIGEASTDAINGSQLYATHQAIDALDTSLSTAGLDFAGNDGTVIHRKLGEQLNIVGGMTDMAATSASSENIRTVAKANGDLEIQLANELTGMRSISFLGDNVSVNHTGLWITGGPSVSTTGIDAGGMKIINVAAGVADTDAVNVSQLSTLSDSIANIFGENVAFDPETGGLTMNKPYEINGEKFHSVYSAIEKLAKGWDINVESGTPGEPGGEGAAPGAGTGTGGPESILPGDQLTLVAGDNIIIEQQPKENGNVNIDISVNPDLDVDSVTAGQTVMDDSGVSVGANVHLGETGLIITGGPSVTTGGINAGNLLITNVAAGSIGTESTDAINGSQIHAINTSVASAFGGGSVVQEDGTVSAPSYTVGNKDTVVNNVGDAIDILNQGWTLTAGGNDSQVQSGDVVSLSNNDGNIVITHAADSGAVAFDLNENITVNNVNATTVNASTVRAGNTVINNSGVSFVNEAGEPVGPSMRPDGIDAGGYPIANVAPGVRPTDAANMGQLSQAVNTINHRIDRVESRADAGTAAAMAVAGLGQPYRPGQSMVSLGSGLWRGETGYALGISTLSGNGKWLIKGAATSSSRGGVGGSASINYAW